TLYGLKVFVIMKNSIIVITHDPRIAAAAADVLRLPALVPAHSGLTESVRPESVLPGSVLPESVLRGSAGPALVQRPSAAGACDLDRLAGRLHPRRDPGRLAGAVPAPAAPDPASSAEHEV